jgi:hypothetical protein
MNRIVLSPSLLSALVSTQTDTESSNQYLYLLRDTYRPKKTTISHLYGLFFGRNASENQEKKSDGITPADESYFSSYE